MWAYDFQSAEWRLCRVECRHDANYDGPLVTLETDVGKVTATAHHPFWVIQGDDLPSRSTPRHLELTEDQGGSLPGRWVNSHELREGDVVILKGRGPVTVRRVTERDEQTPVCNLTVEELHTFAVGEMQVLVHNASGTTGPGQTAGQTPTGAGQTPGQTPAGAGQTPAVPEPTPQYKFEQIGIVYSSEISINSKGVTAIEHYVAKDGEKQLVGVSEISQEGKLTNAFYVADELQKLDISKRMYAEAESVGFQSVAGQYHPDSINYQKFYEFYNAELGNEVEAILQTPAGKVNTANGFKPTDIQPGNPVQVTWVRE